MLRAGFFPASYISAATLQQAVIDRDAPLVEQCLKAGVTPDQRVDSVPLICYAARRSSVLVVELLLRYNADPNITKYTESPLHAVARRGGKDAVGIAKLLVQHRVCVDAVNRTGSTPLHVAVWCGASIELVEFLVQCGASLNIRNCYGYLPIFLAVSYKQPSFLRLLAGYHVDISALRTANGDTLLHTVAVQSGRCYLVVKALVECGASSFSVKNACGDTPMHSVAEAGHSTTLEYFLDYGAPVNAKGPDGDFPLHRAARCGDEEGVTSLLGHHASVDSKNTAGETPLHEAIKAGHFYIVALFTVNGAYFSKTDSHGQSALKLAAERGFSSVVSAFVMDEQKAQPVPGELLRLSR